MSFAILLVYLFIYFICLFVFKLVDDQGRLTVVAESFNIGRDVKIKCDLPGDTFTGWFNERDDRISPGQSITELFINKIRPSDGGIYVCKGKTKRRYYVIYVKCKSHAFYCKDSIQ